MDTVFHVLDTNDKSRKNSSTSQQPKAKSLDDDVVKKLAASTLTLRTNCPNETCSAFVKTQVSGSPGSGGGIAVAAAGATTKHHANSVDGYFQHDAVYTWVGVILLKKEAWRHLVFNAPLRNALDERRDSSLASTVKPSPFSRFFNALTQSDRKHNKSRTQKINLPFCFRMMAMMFVTLLLCDVLVSSILLTELVSIPAFAEVFAVDSAHQDASANYQPDTAKVVEQIMSDRRFYFNERYFFPPKHDSKGTYNPHGHHDLENKQKSSLRTEHSSNFFGWCEPHTFSSEHILSSGIVRGLPLSQQRKQQHTAAIHSNRENTARNNSKHTHKSEVSKDFATTQEGYFSRGVKERIQAHMMQLVLVDLFYYYSYIYQPITSRPSTALSLVDDTADTRSDKDKPSSTSTRDYYIPTFLLLFGQMIRLFPFCVFETLLVGAALVWATSLFHPTLPSTVAAFSKSLPCFSGINEVVAVTAATCCRMIYCVWFVWDVPIAFLPVVDILSFAWHVMAAATLAAPAEAQYRRALAEFATSIEQPSTTRNNMSKKIRGPTSSHGSIAVGLHNATSALPSAPARVDDKRTNEDNSLAAVKAMALRRSRAGQGKAIVKAIIVTLFAHVGVRYVFRAVTRWSLPLYWIGFVPLPSPAYLLCWSNLTSALS